MTSRPLDAIDDRILAELRRNARTSHAQLGQVVQLSRNAVRQRIERLEREGRIRGYTLVEGDPDASARVSATMLVDRADRMRGVGVIDVLRSIPEVVRCEVVAGELDLVVRVEANDPMRIQQVWKQIAALEGVRDITTALALQTVIEREGGAMTERPS